MHPSLRLLPRFSHGLAFFLIATLSVILPGAPRAFAGIFDLSHFLEPGKFSVGLEPEIAVSNGIGLAGNLRPKFGVNDLMNLELIVGTGLGDRRFRLGGVVDLEWFPDHGMQPGIASPLTLLYLKILGVDEIQLSAMPFFYKSFLGNEGLVFTPFIGLPVGWAARDGVLRGYTQLGVGTMIQTASSNRMKFVIEAGFNVYKSYSYISGGVVFYFPQLKSSAEDTNLDNAPVHVTPLPSGASGAAATEKRK